MGKKQYDLSIKLFKESLEIYKKLGDKERQISSLTNIGNAEMQSGKHETAFETLNRALELSIEIDNKISIIEKSWSRNLLTLEPRTAILLLLCSNFFVFQNVQRRITQQVAEGG